MKYWQPNDDFGALTDRLLIDVLKARGYAITKTGNVGRASYHAMESRGAFRALMADTQANFEWAIKAQIGAGIGRALLENKLISIEREEDGERDTITWRGGITALILE